MLVTHRSLDLTGTGHSLCCVQLTNEILARAPLYFVVRTNVLLLDKMNLHAHSCPISNASASVSGISLVISCIQK